MQQSDYDWQPFMLNVLISNVHQLIFVLQINNY